jgi:hypothetical protein
MDVGIIAAIVCIAAVAASGAGALTSYLLARRGASGKVATSEASVLWTQAQEMRGMLMDRLARAEEQRDRLIEAYTTQIFPMLTSISQLVQDLSVAVAEEVVMVRGISEAAEGGEHAVPEGQASSRR